MSVVIDFYVDFVSPNVYLANYRIKEISEKTGAEFRYIPFFLGGVMRATNNQPPWMKNADVSQKLAYMKIEMQRYIARYNVSQFRMNANFPMNSLLCMRLALVAEEDNCLSAFVDDMLRWVWEQSLNMDDSSAVQHAMASGGYPAEEWFARAQGADIKQRLITNTETAVSRGAFGAPTFFIADDIYFGKDKLDDLVYAIEQAASA